MLVLFAMAVLDVPTLSETALLLMTDLEVAVPFERRDVVIFLQAVVVVLCQIVEVWFVTVNDVAVTVSVFRGAEAVMVLLSKLRQEQADEYASSDVQAEAYVGIAVEVCVTVT